MSVRDCSVCTLTPQEQRRRERRFEALAARATSRDETRLVFPPDPRLAAEAAELAALEVACCPLSFRLDVRQDAIELLVLRR